MIFNNKFKLSTFRDDENIILNFSLGIDHSSISSNNPSWQQNPLDIIFESFLKTNLLSSSKSKHPYKVTGDMYTEERDDLREELRLNDPGKTGAFAAENKKWSGSFTEAIKVLAALVFALAMATVALSILVPEVGLLMGNVLVTVFPAMTIAISVLAFTFLAIYLYESGLKVRYEGKLRKINADLQKLSSPLRVAIITGMNLIFLAMINLFWTSVRVVINITGDKPPEIVPLFSQEFVGILPFINLLIISTIIANLLYLVIKSKWVPMTIETVLSIASALLIYAVIQFFPFNPALNSSTLLAIKLGLGFVLVMTLIGAAKNFLKTITLLLQKL